MMPGQPIARKHRAMLDELGEQEVFARLATGTVRAVCRELEISPPRIYEWLDEDDGRRARYEQVKKIKADLLVEEQLEIVDECDDSSTAAVAKAKARAEARRWIASKIHRQAYGNDAAVNVNVATFGEGYLDALRAGGRMGVVREGEPEQTQDQIDAQKWRLLQAGLISDPRRVEPHGSVQDADYEIVDGKQDKSPG